MLWNIPSPDAELTRRLSPLAGGLPVEPPPIAGPMSKSGSFEALEETTFLHRHVLARDEMLMLVGSWSHLASMPPAERIHRLAEVG